MKKYKVENTPRDASFYILIDECSLTWQLENNNVDL
jgi:hypothetical protein